jgi:hypothetical protein
MGLPTRRKEIAGIVSNANGLWLSRIGRDLKDAMDDLFKGSAM